MYGIRRADGGWLEYKTLKEAREFNTALRSSLNMRYFAGIHKLTDGQWVYKEGGY